MIKEFCAENFNNVPVAIANGANRIELCDDLSVGGITPNLDVIQRTIQYAHQFDVKVMTMIRLRAGNFIYDDAEIRRMRSTIIKARRLGTDGIVVGCLTTDNWIDEKAMMQLIADAGEILITFHMAFDLIPLERQFEAVDWLVDHGVTRILTHGGAMNDPINTHYEWLKTLINYADQRIVILPGGGINYQNVDEVVKRLMISEVHGTKIVKLN